MGRRLITGDIHARYEKLRAVLGKAGFDPAEDVLYSVGDFCDRGERPVETLDCLMGLGDSFRPVLGNHDAWLEHWLHTGRSDDNWISGNGGDITFRELSRQPEEWLGRLKGWLSRIPLVRIEDDAIIVHGGIPKGMDEAELGRIAGDRRPIPLFMTTCEHLDLVVMGIDMSEYDRLEELYWDRAYLLSAMDDGRHRFISTGHGRVEEAVPPLDTEKDIWIGHTQLLPSGKPFHSGRYHLYAIDTGAGSGMGPLTVADMDSKTFWQA